jgi:hypothetical protein
MRCELGAGKGIDDDSKAPFTGNVVDGDVAVPLGPVGGGSGRQAEEQRTAGKGGPNTGFQLLRRL